MMSHCLNWSYFFVLFFLARLSACLDWLGLAGFILINLRLTFIKLNSVVCFCIIDLTRFLLLCLCRFVVISFVVRAMCQFVRIVLIDGFDFALLFFMRFPLFVLRLMSSLKILGLFLNMIVLTYCIHLLIHCLFLLLALILILERLLFIDSLVFT